MPSPLSLLRWIDKARSLTPDASSLARISRLYDAQPLIEKAYTPEAVAQSISRSSPKQIALLHPDEFKELSFPIPEEQALPYVKHYANLLRNQSWKEPPSGLFMEHYLNTIREQPFEGFSDLPYLRYKQDPTSALRGQIMGHEGRHRMRSLGEVFPNERFPVEFLGDDLPDRPRFVYPERPSIESIDLSDRKRYASGGQIKGALSLLKRAIHPSEEYQAVRELIHPLVAPRSPVSLDRRTLLNELMSNSELDPSTLTHVFSGDKPKAAYQLSPREDSTYLPYIVSMEKGLGGEALEDAYQKAPKKPLYLYSTPESVGFYRKQPGWVESTEDGISKFTRK